MLPILKWVGGKRRLVPELIDRLPVDIAERRYVEPFCGGAALFFSLEPRVSSQRPQRAWLSDRNIDLIRFYETVRDDPEKVIRATRRLVRRYRADPKATYYSIRDAFNHNPGAPTTQAARFLLLNKTCFNGLWRVNKKGHFNVPMGRYKDPQIIDAKAIREASRLLRDVVLAATDFDRWEYQSDEFIYFDPPYVPVSDTSNFTSYASGGFGEEGQRRLAALFHDLSDREIPCMLSNSDAPLVYQLYAGFWIETVRASRSINSNGNKRGAVTEVIVRNYR